MRRYLWQVALPLLLLALTGAACTGPVTPVSPQPAVRATVEAGNREVWQRPAGGTDREVIQPGSAGTGDRLWTSPDGRGFLKWQDLIVKLYRATTMQVDPCDVVDNTCLAVAAGTVLSSGVSAVDQHLRYTTAHAEIELIGTTLMVAYEPSRQWTIVRVFDGRAVVHNLTTQPGTLSTIEARQWALIEPDKPPAVSNRLEDMRGLARDAGLWDTFHEVEQNVGEGFGPAPVPRQNVDIVFDQPTDTPTPYPGATEPPTPTPEPVCRIVSSTLNFRSGPGTQYAPPIAVLTSGASLVPLERDPSGTWIHVRFPVANLDGWVAAGPEYVQCNLDVGALPVGELPSTPTASLTPMPSWTPQPTPTNSRTPRPTSTYSPTPTPATPPPPVSCSATVQANGCTLLSWDVDRVKAVYLDGQGVAGHDKREVCPAQAQTYTLRVVTGYSADQVCTMKAPAVPTPPPGARWSCSADPVVDGCSTLRWDSANVTAVYLDGAGIAGTGTRAVCPKQTQTFTWRFVTGVGDKYCAATVSIVSKPGTPVLVAPRNGSTMGENPTLVTVQWQPVSDPSGIKAYYLELQYEDPSNPGWRAFKQVSVPGNTTHYVVPLVPSETLYNYRVRWRVMAVNGNGTPGYWSDWWEFNFTLM